MTEQPTHRQAIAWPNGEQWKLAGAFQRAKSAAAQTLQWVVAAWRNFLNAGADKDGIDPYLRLIYTGALILVVGVGGWATTVPLAGAIIATATVVTDTNDKKVQHAIGGIVAEIVVKDGDAVKQGELLLRFDATQVAATLQIISNQLNEGLMREARLKAERDGAKDVSLPQLFAGHLNDPDINAIVGEERRLFASRLSARENYKKQLAERAAQLEEEIRGLVAQQTANEDQAHFITDELRGVRDLYKKNLVQLTRLSALERESSRLGGDRGKLIATIAQTRGKISETQLQILQIDQDLRAEDGKDLRETQAKIAELAERKIAIEDQMRRIDVRSPQAGTVHQLSVHAGGAVVSPGEQIMVIVPSEDTLVLEAKIAPQDIDHVLVGQSAIVRLSAFNQRTTPEIDGRVTFVAADLIKETQTNQSYYLARVTLNSSQLVALDGVKLVPGMPAEIHLATGERTAMSYLLKPLHDQMARAFKEK